MFEKIKAIFNEENIERIGFIRIEDCDIINRRILPDFAKSAVIFCIPYRSTVEFSDDGFSEYSRIYDYHSFSKQLYDRIIPKLSAITNRKFCGFCDHSPINEKIAAVKSGLGFVGRNSLFIDDVYGSFVFLGSLICDIEFDVKPAEIRTCSNCGICIEKCPNSAVVEQGIDRYKCLSGISQKKRKTPEEVALLKEHNIVWGCDICQIVCPHNINAKISPIPYFAETRIKHIDKDFILSLSDEEFSKYAFAYKGRIIVINNIEFNNFVT